MEQKDYYLNECFLEILLPIYEYYTSKQMLQKMVPGMNTNNLESLNSILWNILGKKQIPWDKAHIYRCYACNCGF